jgi:hypothetical protein
VPAWQQNPNEVVPHVVVPAPQVGYPSPAFGGETPPSVPETTTTLPPPGAAVERAMVPPAPLAPGAIPIDPTTGLPLSGKTVESQGGPQTYSAPNIGSGKEALWATNAGITDWRLAKPAQIAHYEAQERAWNLRNKMDDADVTRLRRGMSDGDAEGLRTLEDLRDNLNAFVEVYDTPEKRAQFVGRYNWITQGFVRDINWQGSQDIADFRTALAPFSREALEDKNSPLTGDLKSLTESAPSGSDSPAQFESDLQKLRDRIETKIFQRTAFVGMPESEITRERINALTEQWQQARTAARVRAAQQAEGAPPSPPAAPAPPPAPASAPPPGTAYAAPPGPPPAPAPPPWEPNWIH